MLVSIDIEKRAKPVFQTSRLIVPLYNLIGFLLNGLKSVLLKNLELFILVNEGLVNHVKDLNPSDASAALKKTKRLIAKFDNLNQKMIEIDYMDDVMVKERMKYTLEALYKLESLLHIRATKENPRLETPESVRKGISRLAGEAIPKTLNPST